jgi:hypothetical protein
VPFPVPTVTDLAEYTGRPESSFSAFADSALLQAAVVFTTLTELGADDYGSLDPDQQQLAQMGIMAMGDYVYLRQPYAQVIANPLNSEVIGSYQYVKPSTLEPRNAQALEVTNDSTGVYMFDLAVRALAKRDKLMGVYSGAITGFEHLGRDDSVCVAWDCERQGFVLLGPADRDRLDFPGFADINAEVFPHDPG